ncbi:hypothetical protein CKW00_11465 [Salimicrobium humidisoli]|uniref:Sin domain-containing protein n=1 Tax=Salimicrobium humidisoli TaxID=2029857 RepID=A0ABX4HPC5_9BACI|nr:hypothetical protein CKW00_11465 [Salimicrobium humidisoli]
MNKKLDMEWVELMQEARNLGLSPEEISKFLNTGGQEESPKNITVIQ